MSIFDYLSVLYSVILGLAVTQILLGLRALMLARARVKLYWPALVWAALLILIVAGAWWGMFAMRSFAQWTFGMYATVLAQVTLIYLVAGLAVPDLPPEGVVDMQQMYFAHAGWFFSMFALTVLSTFIKDVITTGHLSSLTNAGFLALFCVLATIASVVRARWYHAALAVFSVVAVIGYPILPSVPG